MWITILYEVITDAYANEVIARNHLPVYAYCEVTDMTGLIVSYTRGSVHYAIQQLSPSSPLHYIRQGLHTLPKTVVKRNQVRRPWWPSNRTLPPSPKISKMWLRNAITFLPKCGGAPLTAVTALVWCGREHLTILIAHLPVNGGSARMSNALEIQTARWLGFQ